MAFDLFQSRRNFYERCRYWKRNETELYEEDVLVSKRIADGMFYAREVNAETDDKNIIAGIIMVSRTAVTIMSPDNLSDIKAEDLVEYQGDIWRVSNIQKRKFRMQNSEFASATNVSHFRYLSLLKE